MEICGELFREMNGRPLELRVAWGTAETLWAQELNGVSTVKTVIKNFFIVVMCT